MLLTLLPSHGTLYQISTLLFIPLTRVKQEIKQLLKPTYTGYARVAVARTAGGWTVSGNNVINAGLVQFGQCTVGTSAVTHASVGTAATGTGQLLWSGALSATLNVAPGIQPQFSAGTLSITED